MTAEQAEAWLMYESVGEIRQAVSSRAALLSGCTLAIGTPPNHDHEDGVPARDSDGKPVDGLDERLVASAEAALAEIHDTMGTHAALIAAQSEAWDIGGEAYLCAWWIQADGTAVPEGSLLADHVRWEVVGPGAYTKEGSGETARQYVQLRHGTATKLQLPNDALVFRLWRRHPMFPDDSWGWVMSALPVCRNLLAYQLAERAQALSAAAGLIHLVPAEAAPRSPDPDPAGPADATGRMMTGDEWAEKLDEMIAEVIGEVIDDWQSGRAVQGGVLAVESKFIEHFGKTIDIGRPIDPGLGALTDRALTRLKEIADVAPEMLSGLGDTNRWNGAQIDDTEYRRYHRPHIRGIVDSWTAEVIWPRIVADGFKLDEARKVRIIVNTQGVVADPDRSVDAEQALRVGAIGYEGYRQMRKIPDDYAPTDDERAIIAEFLSAKPPALGGTPAPPGGFIPGTETPAEPGSGSPSAPPSTVTPVNDAVGSRASRLVAGAAPVDRLGRSLYRVEFDTRAALIAAGGLALDVTMARGAAKLRNLARKHMRIEAPTSCPPSELVETLGRENVQTILAAEFGADDRRRREELFLLALAALRPHYETIARDGLGGALAALGVAIPAPGSPGRSPFTGASISVDDMDAAVADGWETLDESMGMWADERMFGAGLDGQGVDTSAGVPVPIYRRAMASIGGAVVAAGYAALRPSATEPVDASTSMVFGPRLGALEPDPARWEWAYGTAPRQAPFQDHVDLDGELITGPDDPVLADAPWGSYWPGDHFGCLCDVIAAFDTSTP